MLLSACCGDFHLYHCKIYSRLLPTYAIKQPLPTSSASSSSPSWGFMSTLANLLPNQIDMSANTEQVLQRTTTTLNAKLSVTLASVFEGRRKRQRESERRRESCIKSWSTWKMNCSWSQAKSSFHFYCSSKRVRESLNYEFVSNWIDNIVENNVWSHFFTTIAQLLYTLLIILSD